ncbi:hypothetical protein ACPCA8_23400 [Streptomyces capoamus]
MHPTKCIQSRRGIQVAIVATAWKMTTLCWNLVTNGYCYEHSDKAL